MPMPTIQKAEIHKLHPTQLTVGMIEVADKKKHLLALKPHEQEAFMEAHPIPAVVGPAGRLYITDHHHLGRAAFDAGVASGYFSVEDELDTLSEQQFWEEMEKNKWVHPLDANGIRHLYSFIPKHLEKLVDDVYRSLAGYVRIAGGYEKTPTAFAEFVWADFFRRSIAVEDLEAHFHGAVEKAMILAQSEEAASLPGYKKRL